MFFLSIFIKAIITIMTIVIMTSQNQFTIVYLLPFCIFFEAHLQPKLIKKISSVFCVSIFVNSTTTSSGSVNFHEFLYLFQIKSINCFNTSFFNSKKTRVSNLKISSNENGIACSSCESNPFATKVNRKSMHFNSFSMKIELL